MANENKKHIDCANFSPIDAAKGICRLSEKMVAIDSETCPNFKEKKKCCNCANFKNPDKDGMGTCVGMAKEAWTYKDLCAVTCEGYKVKA